MLWGCIKAEEHKSMRVAPSVAAGGTHCNRHADNGGKSAKEEHSKVGKGGKKLSDRDTVRDDALEKLEEATSSGVMETCDSIDIFGLMKVNSTKEIRTLLGCDCKTDYSFYMVCHSIEMRCKRVVFSSFSKSIL